VQYGPLPLYPEVYELYLWRHWWRIQWAAAVGHPASRRGAKNDRRNKPAGRPLTPMNEWLTLNSPPVFLGLESIQIVRQPCCLLPLGLIVTSVPKVPVWKVYLLSVSHAEQRSNSLI